MGYDWTILGRTNLNIYNSLFSVAVNKKICIYCAAGDNGSKDGTNANKYKSKCCKGYKYRFYKSKIIYYMLLQIYVLILYLETMVAILQKLVGIQQLEKGELMVQKLLIVYKWSIIIN